MSDFPAILETLAQGQALSAAQARRAFSLIMDGQAEQAQIGAFLMGLRTLGESEEIIAEGARALRERLTPVAAPANAIDTCGTGGDAKGTYNISTAAALIAAGAGAIVAKHGNKALSSLSGSAEVLERLGVRLDIPPTQIEACMHGANIGFMFAPAHHSAMRHVADARKQLGIRSVFNLLGPLSNPAGVRRQIVGVFAARWTDPLARALHALGCERAWVVHGHDGLDELTLTAPSHVSALENGAVTTFTFDPRDYGLNLCDERALKGGDPAHNARAIRDLLDGKPGSFHDIAILNAAAALMISDTVNTIEDGLEAARKAIASGAAKGALERLVRISNADTP